MKRTAIILGTAAVAFAGLAALAPGGGGRGDGPVVYVTSQDLFYDTIVLGELPQRGRFQLLEMEGPTGLQTEYGPGNRGYVGGRWWVDVNGDGEMDSGDAYFLCPLLGPGRDEP